MVRQNIIDIDESSLVDNKYKKKQKGIFKRPISKPQPPPICHVNNMKKYQPPLREQKRFEIERTNEYIEEQQNKLREEAAKKKRSNIPKTMLVDTKTREVIQHQVVERRMDPEDKNIVSKINQFLIQKRFAGYSRLLGKDNINEKQKQSYEDLMTAWQKGYNRQGQFPRIWTVISDQMHRNFLQNEDEFMNFVEYPDTIKIVNNGLSYGLNPGNSRYFIFALFGMTVNLMPLLYGITFATDQAKEYREQIYYDMLRTFLEANNPEISQTKRQLLLKKKIRGRRDPEQIHDFQIKFPKTLFCKNDRYMQQASDRLMLEFSFKFKISPSFSFRYETMKLKFTRHQIKNQKEIMADGEKIIRKMLQTNNVKDVNSSIDKLCCYNQDFERKYKKFQLNKLCLYHFQKRFVGFHVYQRFEDQFFSYLKRLVLSSQTTLQFLENMLQVQIQENRRPKSLFVDSSHQMNHNARLKRLLTLIEPNVLYQIIEIYKISESLKYEKDEEHSKYSIGSNKNAKKTIVELKYDIWKCECGFLEKIGVPCSHLMRVLHSEKRTRYQDYICEKYFKKPQSNNVVVLNEDE